LSTLFLIFSQKLKKSLGEDFWFFDVIRREKSPKIHLISETVFQKTLRERIDRDARNKGSQRWGGQLTSTNGVSLEIKDRLQAARHF